MIFFFFCQAEDGIRDAQESRGLGDVYKSQLRYEQNPTIPHIFNRLYTKYNWSKILKGHSVGTFLDTTLIADNIPKEF